MQSGGTRINVRALEKCLFTLDSLYRSIVFRKAKRSECCCRCRWRFESSIFWWWLTLRQQEDSLGLHVHVCQCMGITFAVSQVQWLVVYYYHVKYACTCATEYKPWLCTISVCICYVICTWWTSTFWHATTRINLALYTVYTATSLQRREHGTIMVYSQACIGVSTTSIRCSAFTLCLIKLLSYSIT